MQDDGGDMLTHMSLFSGIGGIDLAAEWAGFQTIGQCEWADYPTKVLEKHWPDVPRWKDVRDVTRFSIRQRGVDPDGITLLSGGFPCQPHSLAGKRKASADDRDLWGEFARVICETHPRWVLGENVFGLLSSENGRFFGRVLRDLAEMGYRVGWACYGAVDVGANHRRERVFIVAHADSNARNTWRAEPAGQQRATGIADGSYDVANTVGRGCGENRKRGSMDGICRERKNHMLPAAQSGGHVADTARELLDRRIADGDATGGTGLADGGQDVADAEITEQPRERREARRWRPELGCGGWWATEPDVGRVAHGVPARVDRLKCLGNAVVPQQVYPILQAIADIESRTAAEGGNT